VPDVRGILGEKLGMTQIFDDARAVPVTVIKAGPCFVAQVKTAETDGYSAVQLAFGDYKEGKLNKPMAGHFAKHGDKPGRFVVELRTDDASSYSPGQELRADVFQPGDHADVVGVSRGKGFAGTMKRHGFGGMPGSHGTQKKHRMPGSIGGASTPSRVFKGTRMAGQMGNERVTVLSLQVVHTDPERNLLLLKGATPGPPGGLVMVRTSVKKPARKGD